MRDVHLADAVLVGVLILMLVILLTSCTGPLIFYRVEVGNIERDKPILPEIFTRPAQQRRTPP